MHKAALSKPREDDVPLRLYRPDGDARNTAYWRINGYPTRVIVWTADEWERLERRPDDAQYLPCGLWCALRIDDD